MTSKTIRTTETEPAKPIPGAYQLFPDLPEAEYQELKRDIAEHGVLVPIELDEQGNVLDGHHRLRAWNELRDEGAKVPEYPRVIRVFGDEAEKRIHVRTLNLVRRHLTKAQLKEQIAALREEGLSYRQIAERTAISKSTVQETLTDPTVRNRTVQPDRVVGRDGKSRPAVMPPRPAPSIFATSAREETRGMDALEKLGQNELPMAAMTAGEIARLASRRARETGPEPTAQDPGTLGVDAEIPRVMEKIRRLFRQWPFECRPVIRDVLTCLMQEDFKQW